jgi:hypothetical protein
MQERITFVRQSKTTAMIITVNKYDIHFPGDPTVGIFSQTWQLIGPFDFNDNEEQREFEERLEEFFGELNDDRAHVFPCDENGAVMGATEE